MITIVGTPTLNGLDLEIQYPGQKEVVHLHADNEADACRIAYFQNRKYMIEKLEHWLNQRAVAHQQVGNMEAAKLALKIKDQLIANKEAAFYGLCKLIAAYSDLLNQVAPGIKSRQYGYFEKHIKPIINYCREEKGVAA